MRRRTIATKTSCHRIAADPPALEAEVHAIIDSILRGASEATQRTKQHLADLWPVRLSADLEHARASYPGAQFGRIPRRRRGLS